MANRIRHTASIIVAIDAILFFLDLIWLPILLVIQGFLSVVALTVLIIWVSELQEDFDKKILKNESTSP
jgi:hypothetical protein